ncbi:AAA family ATPase [uncultured Dokdonia sp.]|uniref:McrB family protein n=1 Tax=uncultured Dokdonia sp. TaxID=575653 RepID=UPI0030EE5AC8|tara:strand:+ start:308517 stop:310154 length:1638 start_codon:yes stop_codon:yes gene_type:complete
MVYLKRIQKQDKEKSFFIFKEAFDLFFDENPKEGTTEEINLHYNNTESKAQLQNNGGSDFRIIYFKNKATGKSNRPSYKEGDLVVFNKRNYVYYLNIITPSNKKHSELNSLLGSNNNLIMEAKKHSLNQILFGPPGTGKTYSTIQKSLEILNQHSLDSDISNRIIENREKFKSLLNKRIFFVTMHPSYSYEDFIQGLKPITSGSGVLLFEPADGVFKNVVKKSKELYEDEGEVSEIDIDNKDVLRICFFLSKFNTKTDKKANLFFGDKSPGKVFSKIADKFNLNTNSVKNHRDKFDFLTSEDRKGWKPNNGSNDTLDNSDLWPYDDIYKELKDKTFDEVKSLVDTIYKKSLVVKNKIEDNINFVIILDEINRANISKVFGELITLLEEDKRIDGENELTVTLPSGEVFGVPPNLFIIGTMNTADKSIALVDIALRRRFQFEAMYPKPEIVKEFGKGDDAIKREKVTFMTALNTRLRKDKGVDFQIGHAYFMKENSLEEVINQNIIPLLTEYYRNDLDKVKKIMKDLDKPTDKDIWDTFGLLEFKL